MSDSADKKQSWPAPSLSILKWSYFSSGTLKENTDPFPSWLTTLMAPPWDSTITLAIASPMPVPGAV